MSSIPASKSFILVETDGMIPLIARYSHLRGETRADINIEKRFGAEMRSRFEAIASDYISRGLMAKSGDNYKITEPGIMLSDSIIRDLMYVECEA